MVDLQRWGAPPSLSLSQVSSSSVLLGSSSQRCFSSRHGELLDPQQQQRRPSSSSSASAPRWMVDVPCCLRGSGRLCAASSSSSPPPAGSARPPDTVGPLIPDLGLTSGWLGLNEPAASERSAVRKSRLPRLNPRWCFAEVLLLLSAARFRWLDFTFHTLQLIILIIFRLSLWFGFAAAGLALNAPEA